MNKKSEEKITQYPNSIDTRVALLEASISHINETLIRIERSIDEVKKDIKQDFRFTIMVVAGLAAIMAHGFKWF